jgi:hypothetical protein
MKTKAILSAPVIETADRSLNNSIPHKWFALGLSGILFISVCALLPSPAQAQCRHWDVSGTWTLHEKGGGDLQVTLRMEKWQGDSANITGTGRLKMTGGPDIAVDLDGNITDNSFAMRMMANYWIKRYQGTISADGKIEGDWSLEKNEDPGGGPSKGRWYSIKKMTCVEAKAEQSTSNDAEDQHKKNKQSAQAGISASPKVVPLSGRDEGTTTITWNAGAGRPNAEVWVQVNDHDAKLLFTGSKGTETVTVKTGRKYLYMLRDGGQQLDTVTVKAAGQQGEHHHHHDGGDDQNQGND